MIRVDRLSITSKKKKIKAAYTVFFVVPSTYLPIPPFIGFYILVSTKVKLVNIKQTDYMYMDSFDTLKKARIHEAEILLRESNTVTKHDTPPGQA